MDPLFFHNRTVFSENEIFFIINRRKWLLKAVVKYLFSNTGLLTENEKEVLELLDRKTKQHKTYLPFLWACRVVDQAKREGLIKDALSQKAVTDEILRLRGCCGELLGWDDYNIPLVYTQVGMLEGWLVFPLEGIDISQVFPFVSVLCSIQF